MIFPISGVEVNPLVPVVVAFGVSFVCSVGGISGAFLLLPFQMSVLGFTSPAVSPTNLIFNVVAIPGGVFRYIREGRMVWPLAGVIVAGTLPGLAVGAVVRVKYLPDARSFKFFVGWVLLYMAYRLIADSFRKADERGPVGGALAGRRNNANCEAGNSEKSRIAWARQDIGTVRTVSWNFKKMAYEFQGKTFTFKPSVLLFMALAVGVIGGIYGIGGGAIIAPFIVTFFRLPVHTIAGATLLGTFLSSAAGILFYLAASYAYAGSGLTIAPDWPLGICFGMGGLAGIYCGARAQRYLQERIIKAGLAALIGLLAVRYIGQYFA